MHEELEKLLEILCENNDFLRWEIVFEKYLLVTFDTIERCFIAVDGIPVDDIIDFHHLPNASVVFFISEGKL